MFWMVNCFDIQFKTALRLDMYARLHRDGWYVWGNEVAKKELLID